MLPHLHGHAASGAFESDRRAGRKQLLHLFRALLACGPRSYKANAGVTSERLAPRSLPQVLWSAGVFRREAGQAGAGGRRPGFATRRFQAVRGRRLKHMSETRRALRLGESRASRGRPGSAVVRVEHTATSQVQRCAALSRHLGRSVVIVRHADANSPFGGRLGGVVGWVGTALAAG